MRNICTVDEEGLAHYYWSSLWAVVLVFCPIVVIVGYFVGWVIMGSHVNVCSISVQAEEPSKQTAKSQGQKHIQPMEVRKDGSIDTLIQFSLPPPPLIAS